MVAGVVILCLHRSGLLRMRLEAAEKDRDLANETLRSIGESYQQSQEDLRQTTDSLMEAVERIDQLKGIAEENVQLRKLLEEINCMTSNYSIPF